MAAQYDPRQEAALLERIAAEKPLGLVVAGTPWASHTERFRALLTQGVRVVHLDPPPAAWRDSSPIAWLCRWSVFGLSRMVLLWHSHMVLCCVFYHGHFFDG